MADATQPTTGPRNNTGEHQCQAAAPQQQHSGVHREDPQTEILQKLGDGRAGSGFARYRQILIKPFLSLDGPKSDDEMRQIVRVAHDL